MQQRDPRGGRLQRALCCPGSESRRRGGRFLLFGDTAAGSETGCHEQVGEGENARRPCTQAAIPRCAQKAASTPFPNVISMPGCPVNWGWGEVSLGGCANACMALATQEPCGRLPLRRSSLTWSPIGFHHPEWDVSLVVHGSDFTALGADQRLNRYEEGMAKAFECELRGRLGEGPQDLKEVPILNTKLCVTNRGLRCEAGQRHVPRLAPCFGTRRLQGYLDARREVLLR